MKIPPPISDILPGDHLLYYSGTFLDWWIAVKCGYRVAHIEIYEGQGNSVASRNGIGVNRYLLRKDGLVAILRPRQKFDADNARNWFETVKGQGYDWTGLASFYLMEKYGDEDKQFCSEFGTNWDRAAGIASFNSAWEAWRVSPRDFMESGAFEWFWVASATAIAPTAQGIG